MKRFFPKCRCGECNECRKSSKKDKAITHRAERRAAHIDPERQSRYHRSSTMISSETCSESHGSVTYNYTIWTRSSINGEWIQQYPTFVRINPKTKIQKFLSFVGLRSSLELSSSTPYIGRIETAEIAKKYLNEENIQDVEIRNEWYDSSGYGNWGEYVIWRNGKWVN